MIEIQMIFYKIWIIEMDDMYIRATYTIITTVFYIMTVAATLKLKIIMIENLDVFCVKIL